MSGLTPTLSKSLLPKFEEWLYSILMVKTNLFHF